MSAGVFPASGESELSHWEGCTAQELERAWGVPRVRLLARTGSTNDVAREMAAGGAPEWSVVVAEEQLRGRGRAGRGWVSPPGLGLWMSILLRPTAEAGDPVLPIRVAAVVADVLEGQGARGRIRIKWPNDIVAEGGKVCGILCEATWEAGRPAHLVVGVGVNLLHGPADFPSELRGVATSLRALTDAPVSRFGVAGAVLGGLRRELSEPRGAAELIAGRDALLGRSVEVVDPSTGTLITAGRARGIAADGALLLERGGAVHPVRSGTVRAS